MYKIYYDAYQEALWFKSLNPKLADAELQAIINASSPEITRLLRYDKPDIILEKDGKAVISLEKTTEVPTGHNVGQRFGRIVCAAEEGVIGIYFGPYLSMKHGKYSGRCYINTRLLEAMLNLKKIYGAPSLAVNWKCDADCELIHGGQELEILRDLICQLIDNNFSFNTEAVKVIENEMNEMVKETIVRKPSYMTPPPTALFVDTKNYRADPRLRDYNFPDYFFTRAKSLNYKVGMAAGLRSDPFTGTQLIYDYCYLREGKTIKDRKANLVVEIPDLTLSDWNSVTNDNRKDKKLLKMFPDLLLLKDGHVQL